MSRRLMSLICLGMYCLCLWLAVQTVEKVRQISPGVSLRYAQALTGEQVKKAQTYIKSSQNTDADGNFLGRNPGGGALPCKHTDLHGCLQYRFLRNGP